MNPKTLLLWLAISFFCPACLKAQRSKDGSETITTSGVIFNRYAVLATSVSAGSATITVTDINDLAASAIPGASNNPYLDNLPTYGDLVMVIKMQGADIDQSNTSSYGQITTYNGTGIYEFAVVKFVTGNTINLCIPSVNGYSVSSHERVQVIRVPRLSSLTITPAGQLTGRSWGAVAGTGGVVSIEVDGNTVVDGAISANGIGFKGGLLDNNTSLVSDVMTFYTSSNSFDGAEKGEGIAGNQSDYDAIGGRYNRGAPANGGGGGNGHNTGGGGGANAGTPGLWSGMGNPDISIPGWTAAWDLEGPGFSVSSSTGGGRGGYSYSGMKADAFVNPPGHYLWQGSYRQNAGGYGGRPLNYVGNRLFAGGGGGSGDANDLSGSAGADGGGIIYLTVYHHLSGSGNITADGNAALPTNTLHKDGAGGGGGGGTILMNVQGTLSGLNLSAKGGNGGCQLITTDEAEGPGGGGGGGYIATTNTGLSAQVNGGTNGTTASAGMDQFIPNGATIGGSGQFINTLTFGSMQPLFCGVLPVKIISFTAQTNKAGNNEINWVTQNEEGILKYEVEQSSDMNSWIKVNEQVSQGKATEKAAYKTELKNSRTPSLYFRLKIINRDGGFYYSEIRSIKLENKKGLLMQQNNDQVTLFFKIPPQKIRLYSSAGQLIKDDFHLTAAVIVIDKSNLQSGVYYIQVMMDNEIITLSFIK